MASYSRLSYFLLRATTIPFTRLIWRPKVINPENMPLEGPCFIYGNHSNYMDPFLINLKMTKEPTAGVMTREFLRGGIVSNILSGLGLLPTDKQVPEPGLIRGVMKLLKQKRMVLIFPEGGRPWAGRPIPWIETTAKLFVKAGVPVHPVRIHGSYMGWPRWAKFPRPARIQIEFLPPLMFNRKDDWREAMAMMQSLMIQDETIVADTIKPKWAYKPAVGIENILYRCPETGENNAIFSPDGKHVENKAGTLKFKMLPDSSLINLASDEHVYVSDLYEKIKTMPFTPAEDGVILSNRVKVELHVGQDGRVFQGNAQGTINKDEIVFSFKDKALKIPIDSLLYIDAEMNHKTRIATTQNTYTIIQIGKGSALQWQDTLKRLKLSQ